VTPVCSIWVKEPVKGVTLPQNRAIRGIYSDAPLLDDVWNKVVEFNYTYMCGQGTESSLALNESASWLYNVTRYIPPELRIFMSLGAPSFQLTSCILFVNFSMPRQIYDGLKLISLGNLYDIPPYEEQTGGREVFGTEITGINATRLLKDEQVPFRLYRTALASYFIYNTYVQLIFILACIALHLLLQALYHYEKVGMGWASLGWAMLDFSLEYFIMYLFISGVITIESFNKQGWVSIFSLVLCVLIVLGFIAYHLYRFADFIRLADVKPGHVDEFEEMTVKFGHLVKNTRPTLDSPHWLLRPWVTPHFYHLISPIKKIGMMLAFALFAEYAGWQLATVSALQLVEFIRLVAVRPYIQTWRNVLRGCIEALMFVAFILLLVLSYSEEWVDSSSISAYNGLGWLVLIICYLFNLHFLAMLFVNLYEKCKGECQLIRDQRQNYYYEKAKEKDVSVEVWRQMVIDGNLTNANSKKLPDIEVRIEWVALTRIKGDIQVDVTKCLELRMNPLGGAFHETNNTDVVRKFKKSVRLSKIQDEGLKTFIRHIFGENDHMEVKTFVKVSQKMYKYGEKIPLDPSCQEITTRRKE
jgi:hypothetical protein